MINVQALVYFAHQYAVDDSVSGCVLTFPECLPVALVRDDSRPIPTAVLPDGDLLGDALGQTIGGHRPETVLMLALSDLKVSSCARSVLHLSAHASFTASFCFQSAKSFPCRCIASATRMYSPFCSLRKMQLFSV